MIKIVRAGGETGPATPGDNQHREIAMRYLAMIAVPLMLLSGGARAGEVTGSGAFALAALAGMRSPALSEEHKKLLKDYFNGKTDAAPADGKPIAVAVDSIKCTVSNVDLASRSCMLVYAGKKVGFKGRAANELFTMLGDVGIAKEGAAGSITAGLEGLACEINQAELKAKAGGGAKCAFK